MGQQADVAGSVNTRCLQSMTLNETPPVHRKPNNDKDEAEMSSYSASVAMG